VTARAEISIDPTRVIGTIDEGIYGQFIEQMGRVVYGGITDAGDNVRADTLDAVRGLKPSVLRIGGNKSSGYHWRDGVGPRETRPKRRDLAWGNVETNAFGTDEFVAYSRSIGAEPYICLNMATGTIDEALGWLEYCNGTVAGIPEVDLRGGAPHEVLLWGLGNELYGWWQHVHMTASQYGAAARDYGKLMRWTDNRIKLIACGSPDPDWNWTVLDLAARAIDWISLHFYWRGSVDERLRGPLASEAVIVQTWDMCVEATKAHHVPRPIKIAVDEWGVWSKTFPEALQNPEGHAAIMERGMRGTFGDTSFEESYDFADALTVASWLHVLWRHPEKVTLATQAQMVNTIAPILTSPDGVVRQTIYWPLSIARQHAGTESVSVECRSDVDLDVACTRDPSAGRTHVSIVNRSPDEDVEVSLDGLGEALVVTLRADVDAANTFDRPDAVVPSEIRTDASRLVVAPLSHTTVVA
jgi:alpha-L-arabinofuranosidase